MTILLCVDRAMSVKFFSKNKYLSVSITLSNNFTLLTEIHVVVASVLLQELLYDFIYVAACLVAFAKLD